jgi:hypothetical protein
VNDRQRVLPNNRIPNIRLFTDTEYSVSAE